MCHSMWVKEVRRNDAQTSVDLTAANPVLAVVGCLQHVKLQNRV